MKKAIFLLIISFFCSQICYAMDNDEMPDLSQIPREDWGKYLCIYAGDGNIEACEYLINAGVSPNEQHQHYGSPLITAAHFGKKKAIRLLLRAGAAIDQANPNGQTALMEAAYEGKLLAVLLLLSQGADPNLKRTNINLDAMTLGGCGNIGLTYDFDNFVQRKTNSNQIPLKNLQKLYKNFRKYSYQLNRETIAKILLFFGYSNTVAPELRDYKVMLSSDNQIYELFLNDQTRYPTFLDNPQQYIQEHPDEFEFIQQELLLQLPTDVITFINQRQLGKRYNLF